MAVGCHDSGSDTLPVQLAEGQIGMVSDFTYLGSNITSDGEVKEDVKICIGKAARAFGCLQRAVFQYRRLSVETKRKVYKAVVLSVLLYVTETWAIKVESLRRLTSFHNRCVRSIMGVTKYQHWEGKDNITEACSGVWYEGDHDTLVDEAAPSVAWPCSPNGTFSFAQTAALW